MSEVIDVERALSGELDAIMDSYEKNRVEYAIQAPEQPAWAVIQADFDEPIPPRWADGIDAALSDPVRFAHKAAVRDVGWRAFTHGGLDCMSRVLSRSEKAGAWGGVIDRWWDMIGPPGGPWWCS